MRLLRTFSVPGLLRVFGLLMVVQALGMGLWLKSARARLGEAMLTVGAEIWQLQQAHASEAPRVLAVNGARVHLRTASTDQSVASVLDKFHAVCRTRTGVQTPEAVLKTGPSASREWLPTDGVLRVEAEGEGALACVDTGGPLPLRSLLSRLEQFAQDGDLSHVGELRYVLARRIDGKTAVFLAWTEGSVPLLAMFPKSGDALGRDTPEVPRAPGLRRVLSSWEEGQPYSIGLYVSASADLDATVHFYRTELARLGWTVDRQRELKPTDPVTVVGRRQGRVLLIRVARASRGGLSVSIAELG